jgi:hypothetical protein
VPRRSAIGRHYRSWTQGKFVDRNGWDSLGLPPSSSAAYGHVRLAALSSVGRQGAIRRSQRARARIMFLISAAAVYF